jgi:hypothetical protein
MYICKVCGYDGLEYPQYLEKGEPFFTICACCGFESGFDDLDQGFTIEEYRKKWIDSGAKWFVESKKPTNWDMFIQLGGKELNCDNISKLPDVMSVDELKAYFIKVLNRDVGDYFERTKAAEDLRELADRQWHTYEKIDCEIKQLIEQWISKTWNLESEDYVKSIVFVIGSLGLTDSFELMKKSLERPMNKQILSTIKKFVAEREGNIENPYFGM